MEITDVQIMKMQERGQLLAYANVVLNNFLVLKGIKLIDGDKGKFIVMPSQQIIRKRGVKRFEYYHPIKNEMRELLTQAIIDKYSEQEEK